MKIFPAWALVSQPDFGKAGDDQQLNNIRLHAERHRHTRRQAGRQDIRAIRKPHHVLGGILEAGSRGLPPSMK